MGTTKSVELTRECKRQFDNCLYTAASLHIWLRWLRGWKIFFTLAPIFFGAVGSAKILTNSNDSTMKAIGAMGSFLGGVLSTIYAALKLDTNIGEAKTAAGEFTNLRDAFRQAALVSSKKSFEEFEAEFVKLRTRLEKVRSLGVTPPEVCFKLAQRKIRAGDYNFDVDEGDEGASLPGAGESKPENLLKK
jgi:hypothetical protein